jgi:2,3-bisphosphoglycerate-independent phosphoglycerate mutase
MGNSRGGPQRARRGARLRPRREAGAARPSPRGRSFEGAVWRELVARVKTRPASRCTSSGCLSDGNVHSHHRPPLRAAERCHAKEAVKQVRVHVLFDGRDVPETSALDYIDPLEALLASCQRSPARLPRRQRRRADDGDHGPLRGGLGDGGAGWAAARAGRGARLPQRARGGASAARRAAGRHDQNLPGFVVAHADGRPWAASATARRWSCSTSAATGPSRSRAP